MWHQPTAIPSLGGKTACATYGRFILNAFDGASGDRRAWHRRGVYAPESEIAAYLTGLDGMRVLVGAYGMGRSIDARHILKRFRGAVLSSHGLQVGTVVFGPNFICALGAAMLGVPENDTALLALVLETDHMNVPAAMSMLWMLVSAANLHDSPLKLEGPAKARVAAFIAKLDPPTSAALRLLGVWADAMLALLDVATSLSSVLRCVLF